MLNIAFDTTILTSIYKKDAARSGIFFAALNVFLQLTKRKDVKLFLYSNPSSYVEYQQFHKEYCPQEQSLYCKDVHWFLIALYNWFLKKHTHLFTHVFLRKPFALGILIARHFVKKSASSLIDYEMMNACDVFFSPVYAIPREVRKKKMLKCLMLYDAIPLKYPEYYPTGSFLDDIKREGSLDDIHIFDSFCALKDFKKYFSFVKDENSCVAYLAANEKFVPKTNCSISSQLRIKYKIPENKRFIFSLCTLEPRKNLVRAIKTFIQFVKKNEVHDLVWVLGGGHWTSFYKQFSEETGTLDKFEELIVSAGYIDDEDLPALYSSAEWFVYTSQYEGFGLPPLEAMQCGCPVITSNNTSLPEVVGDAGIMIDWDSDEQHVAAYEKYYFNENLRKENSRKGLERAKLFSWEKTVDQMVRVMKENMRT